MSSYCYFKCSKIFLLLCWVLWFSLQLINYPNRNCGLCILAATLKMKVSIRYKFCFCHYISSFVIELLLMPIHFIAFFALTNILISDQHKLYFLSNAHIELTSLVSFPVHICLNVHVQVLALVISICNGIVYLLTWFILWLIFWLGQKQGRNEFVIRLQPLEAMYMKLTVRAWLLQIPFKNMWIRCSGKPIEIFDWNLTGDQNGVELS